MINKLVILFALSLIITGCAESGGQYPDHFYSYQTKKYAPHPRVSRAPSPESTTGRTQIIFMPEGWFMDSKPPSDLWKRPHPTTFSEMILETTIMQQGRIAP